MNKLLVGVTSVALLVGCAGTIRVLNIGLGAGEVTSSPSGIRCGMSCQTAFAENSTVVLTAMPDPGSSFMGWDGNCSGTAPSCSLVLSSYRSAIARFEPNPALPRLTPVELTPEGIRDFLVANPQIDSPARFIAALDALPQRFKDNWILMANSESLQTGTAISPRVLMPGSDGRQIFSFSLTTHANFPHANPNIIEYLHFDTALGRFRFHEIGLASRTVAIDAPTCMQCHSGRPNWDSYDNWGGMLPFNRDRIYKGSLDAAAMRNTLDLWSKGGHFRTIIEQLNLPAGMQRTRGGQYDGHIEFPSLDGTELVLIEPRPSSTLPSTAPLTSRLANYPATSPASTVFQGGDYYLLRNSSPVGIDEGRGVDLFDNLTPLNAKRIAQDLIEHPRTPVDVRPIALAVARGCDLVPALNATQLTFFNTRNGVADLAAMVSDTQTRRRLLPRMKADLQRTSLLGPLGMIEGHGLRTAQTRLADEPRVRQELFRRPQEAFDLDALTGLMIDRETYDEEIGRFRYFLEPLGVAVDKWSMSVHGRSRTYTFADLFPTYLTELRTSLAASLVSSPSNPATNSATCATLATASQAQFANLPGVGVAPLYAEVQRVFNRNCLECHGSFTVGSGPYVPTLVPGLSHGALLAPATGSPRVVPNNPAASRLYQRVTSAASPMPPSVNGPMLSGADVDVIRRWILAGAPP